MSLADSIERQRQLIASGRGDEPMVGTSSIAPMTLEILHPKSHGRLTVSDLMINPMFFNPSQVLTKNVLVDHLLDVPPYDTPYTTSNTGPR